MQSKSHFLGSYALEVVKLVKEPESDYISLIGSTQNWSHLLQWKSNRDKSLVNHKTYRENSF